MSSEKSGSTENSTIHSRLDNVLSARARTTVADVILEDNSIASVALYMQPDRLLSGQQKVVGIVGYWAGTAGPISRTVIEEHRQDNTFWGAVAHTHGGNYCRGFTVTPRGLQGTTKLEARQSRASLAEYVAGLLADTFLSREALHYDPLRPDADATLSSDFQQMNAKDSLFYDPVLQRVARNVLLLQRKRSVRGIILNNPTNSGHSSINPPD